jgi:adenylate cyclase
MSEIIFLNKWFINKYEWDAIMALRWVFTKEENISKKACETALLQKNKLIELNKKWEKKWIPKINVRIWINSWEAIIWNIWAIWKKLEFTAIWDNVNLASRLESINKFYSTYICVSETTYIETKDMFEFRYLDKIKVKWKNIAINIYELLNYKWLLNEAEQSLYSDFQKWIVLYLNREFKKALEIFDKLIEFWDKPSLVYKERCIMYIDNPPDDSWDQSWTMIEK